MSGAIQTVGNVTSIAQLCLRWWRTRENTPNGDNYRPSGNDTEL